MSYSELLGMLGQRFTRPKMRAVCKKLDAVKQDDDGAGLAVLVVGESDRLPRQGWWTGQTERGYAGAWEGAGCPGTCLSAPANLVCPLECLI